MKKLVSIGAILMVLAGGGCRGRGGAAANGTGEAWLASSIDGQPVGYSVYRYSSLVDGYRFESYVKMTLTMGGKPQRVESRSEVYTNPDLTLRSFDFDFGTSERSFSVRGNVADGKLTIFGMAGQSKGRVIELKTQVYPMSALGRLVVSRDMSTDSVYRLPVFDVTVLDVVPVDLRYLGREKVTIGGREYDARKVKVKVGRLDLVTWYDDKGLALAEESPPGMRSERTTAEALLERGDSDGKLDILAMFRVPVDTVIPEGEMVARLRLQVSGVDTTEARFDWQYQQVLGTNPLVIEVTVPPLPGGPVGLPVQGEAEFLKPSVTIQSDAPAVKAKAAEATGEARDAVEAARKLVSWAFTLIDKEATASYPTALDVLEHMEGDCNEHAVVVAALARAAGIPAKVAVGLVYLNGAFYYHAWNELYLGKWIPVDATFGEFPASALHVKFAEGELSTQSELLGIVGRIGLQVTQFDVVRSSE
jgi:hypothetical protein